MKLARNTIVLVTVICSFAVARLDAGVAVTDWQNAVRPDAIADLRTVDGAKSVKATWRVRVAEVVASDKSHDLTPRAGAADFDDSAWDIAEPASLEERRGDGRLSFVWYRTRLTIPPSLGDFNTSDTCAVFEIVADDYAEVWVDGKLPQVLGGSPGRLVTGWNAPNRITLTRHARPGQTFQIALLAANAPLSRPPTNKVWIRSAVVKFYAPARLATSQSVKLEVVRFDPKIDAIIAPGTAAEHLATGFGFTEGPVWVPADENHDGFLLFSDPNNNAIHRYDPLEGMLNVYRPNSGYTGADIGRYRQPGSNGLALDPQGRLTICEHGNRRVTRLEKNGAVTVLADRYEGKRLNSPNDLVYRSDGTLFFTDPPFGLPKAFDDEGKELPMSGVFRWTNGELMLVAQDMIGPNGLALSPDERHLYVSNWDERRKIVMRYDVSPDGSLSNASVFADVTGEPGADALDGLKVDGAGNVLFCGPGGVWVFDASGKKLGLLKLPELPANLAWADGEPRTLYITARTGLYRVPVRGVVTEQNDQISQPPSRSSPGGSAAASSVPQRP